MYLNILCYGRVRRGGIRPTHPGIFHTLLEPFRVHPSVLRVQGREYVEVCQIRPL
jgi:hypothetical protein